MKYKCWCEWLAGTHPVVGMTVADMVALHKAREREDLQHHAVKEAIPTESELIKELQSIYSKGIWEWNPLARALIKFLEDRNG